jgi:hypothetical protein
LLYRRLSFCPSEFRRREELIRAPESDEEEYEASGEQAR